MNTDLFGFMGLLAMKYEELANKGHKIRRIFDLADGRQIVIEIGEIKKTEQSWRTCEECPIWCVGFYPMGYCCLTNQNTMEDRVCPLSGVKYKEKVQKREEWNKRI